MNYIFSYELSLVNINKFLIFDTKQRNYFATEFLVVQTKYSVVIKYFFN